MSGDQRRGNVEILSAIAAITGKTSSQVDDAFHQAKDENPDTRQATADEVSHLLDMVATRLGLAPAVMAVDAESHRAALSSLAGDDTVTFTRSDLHAWDDLLRHTPEHVPTIERDPVLLPPLPEDQTGMWQTLLELEGTGQPWVLIGGQMTMLHCLEHSLSPSAPPTTAT